jgi:hypothetical protein
MTYSGGSNYLLELEKKYKKKTAPRWSNAALKAIHEADYFMRVPLEDRVDFFDLCIEREKNKKQQQSKK